MKILFDHPFPFQFAHGGFQIQIERTKKALEQIGVEVEFLRWWDAYQRGDLIHYFSGARFSYLQEAKKIRMPVVMTSLFSETCNRSNAKLATQRLLVRTLLSIPGATGIKDQLHWKTFHVCERNIVGLKAEIKVLEEVYGVAPEKISAVPLGLSETFLNAPPATRSENHLICTGTIYPVKNSVLLAEMAHKVQVPILFVGKPFDSNDPYWLRFKRLIDGRWVKYQSHVSEEKEMVELLRAARGYVLFSDFENWSLSSHEAAACGLPLLLRDQNWSRERFGSQASYFAPSSVANQAASLRTFYETCPSLAAPRIQLFSWKDVAERLRSIYTEVLSTSR